MDTSPIIPFPAAGSGQVFLVLHPHPTLGGRLLELAAQLALAALQSTGSLLVLDGGNCFNVYPVARHLRRHTGQVSAALQHIQVARAFTCFEVASLLQRTALALPATAPAGILVLDILSTFRDENTPLAERLRLLRTCLPHLRQLASAAPLLVSAGPADPELTSLLLQCADHLLELEAPAAPHTQPELPGFTTLSPHG
jgi:hypothetical protein